jgi:arylsulfatase A-like enzyme
MVALAALVFGRHFAQDRAGRPSSGPPAAPNILLIVLDTVRADSLGCWNASQRRDHATPFLDSLADDSVTFRSAIAPSSWTLPSHASIFTGRFPLELSAGWYTPLDGRWPTLAEVLAKHGYSTAAFVGNTTYCARTTGLGRGFGHYEDFPQRWDELLRHSVFVQNFERKIGFAWLGIYDDLGHKAAPAVSDSFLHWLDRQNERPFFAFLNYFDAHAPYLPQHLTSQQRNLTSQEKTLLRHLVDADRSELGQHAELLESCYLEVVEELDAELQRLAHELERRHLWDNTIVIITSDHGEQFGEHGVFYHGNSLYRPAVYVPLIISNPASPTGHRAVRDAVSLTDLGATILDLAGLQPVDNLAGHSFWPLAGDQPPAPHPVFSMVSPGPKADRFSNSPLAKGTITACLRNGIYLIREGDGSEQAFDFVTDPNESTNLLESDAATTQRVEDARQTLHDRLRRFPTAN